MTKIQTMKRNVSITNLIFFYFHWKSFKTEKKNSKGLITLSSDCLLFFGCYFILGTFQQLWMRARKSQNKINISIPSIPLLQWKNLNRCVFSSLVSYSPLTASRLGRVHCGKKWNNWRLFASILRLRAKEKKEDREKYKKNCCCINSIV